MNHRYKPDDYETKLIILYSIKNLKQSPTYAVLGQVVTGSADINYFEIQHYMEELTELKTIEEYMVDGQNVYSLTQAGEEMCEFFSSRIPGSIRQKIEDAAYEINNDKSRENRVYANYIPINEQEYKVNCGIMEDNIKLLDFEMYAGSKERAKKICEYFKENTSSFYTEVVALIEKNIREDQS